MENLVRAQYDLKARISRTVENLKKLGSARITRARIATTISLLEAKWVKVEEQHRELQVNYRKELREHSYMTQDFLDAAEEAYAQQRTMLLELEESLTATADDSQSTAIRASPTLQTTLPEINLPKFSGKYEDWPPFKGIFQSLIAESGVITDVTKFHYLKASLEGEAAALIQGLPTTGENYQRAWDKLVERYENTRLLVRSYYNSIVAFPALKSESSPELKRLFNCMITTVGALESIGRPITSSEDFFVLHVTELLDARSRREWETKVSGTSEPPTYEDLRKFMERRLQAIEAMQPTKSEQISTSQKTADRASRSTRSHHGRKQEAKQDSKIQCFLCKKEHFLMLCDQYKAKSPAQRKQFVDEQQLCLNCLGRHRVSECSSKRSCSVCCARHHSSLHDACRSQLAASEETKVSHVAHNPLDEQVAVLLATARVRVADRYGDWIETRALVDQGSEGSMVSEALAQRLRLPRRKANVAVYGVGGQQAGVARGQINLTVAPLNGGGKIAVSAMVLPRLTVYSGVSSETVRKWTHLQGLPLADPEFMATGPMELLLGADVYARILGEGVVKGGPREPMAQQTALGWIVSGIAGALPRRCAAVYQCSVGDPLSVLVRRFWELDELPIGSASLTAEEQECETLFARFHSRDSEGRYIVRLPIKNPCPDLTSSRAAAIRALRGMETRFRRDSSLHQSYKEFMNQYRALGHMTRAPAVDSVGGERNYLPHHGVTKETSTTTKLRVVFNGSLVTANGSSLNDHVLVGPNLLPPLVDVLLRWRWHRYVVVADVEKMYRQILVHQDDRDWQRIVWRDSSDRPMEEYRLNTVTYGLACAPFLAIRVMRQLADDEELRFPLGAATLRRDVYMDDVLAGAGTTDEARALRRQLTDICRAGGFPLRKWASNEDTIVAEIPEEDRAHPGAGSWQPPQSHATLGLRWYPADDTFAVTVRPIEWMPVTRRTILSQAARLFDPLGWVAPVVIRAKIIVQSTWLLGLDWDEPVPSGETEQWRRFQEELPLLADVRIPRWLRGGETVEIHGFADASERAYAAVAYLRTKTANSVELTLMEARTRVAPVKQVSLPRLELCAADLLARMVSRIQNVLEIGRDSTYLWTDSTVVLGWLRGHPSKWKTFVANRVSQIQTTVPEARWGHVPSEFNPADCASRGLSPGELLEHALWWRGPPWLRSDVNSWNPPGTGCFAAHDDLPELRIRVQTATFPASRTEDTLLERCSSLRRLIRITAWCCRWVSLLRETRSGVFPGVLSADEVDQSLLRWVRIEQTAHYHREVGDVRKGDSVRRRSTITHLDPFLDATGILRVGGRLRHSLLAFDERHPMILAPSSRLTTLIIEACHARVLHGGVQQTLSCLRQRFWVPRGRAQVKAVIHRCIRCVRWRAAIPRQIMSDLPTARVKPSRPFQNTGVDYAGPIMLRVSGGRGHKAAKAYLAVFVCLSTRAVHLEVVSDYTAEAFLAAFRRFVARRGLCQVMYSDCGTNFVGADTALRALFTASSREGGRIQAALADDRVQWRFNPPGAPHFGGLWEAAVKSVKHHLRRVIGDSTLTYEEMSTFLAQVEACLNSRPLQPLTDDPQDLCALTPGHFLIGSAPNSPPEPSLAGVTVGRLTRWQHVQQMREHFWNRWSKEYIHSLTPRPKWQAAEPNVSVGRLCLLRSETTSPARWPLARVIQVHPGQDGRVRVVTVRTAASELTRPIAKIVLLPMDEREEVAAQGLAPLKKGLTTH